VRGELARFGAQAGLAELVERWPAAVGEAIARHAWPARIARDGTVHVATADSVWAFELGHQAGAIAARLDVARLRFAPGPLPTSAPEGAPTPSLEPSREELRTAAEIAADLTDENLRETVQKAIGFSLARRRSEPFV